MTRSFSFPAIASALLLLVCACSSGGGRSTCRKGYFARAEIERALSPKRETAPIYHSTGRL